MRASGKLRGWVALPTHAESDARHDPVAAKRLALKAVGPRAIARELASFAALQPGALFEEHVVPLFAAPPDVCEDAGRTLYYGLVPTTSSELAQAPAEGPRDFGPDTDAFRNHLVGMLTGDAMTFDTAGQTVAPAWRAIADIAPTEPGHVASLTLFVRMLEQLAIELRPAALPPLRRPRLSHRLARPALGDPKHLLNVLHRRTPPPRAQ